MINIQWTKFEFEQESIVSFISEELPQNTLEPSICQIFQLYQVFYLFTSKALVEHNTIFSCG